MNEWCRRSSHPRPYASLKTGNNQIGTEGNDGRTPDLREKASLCKPLRQAPPSGEFTQLHLQPAHLVTLNQVVPANLWGSHQPQVER